MVVVAKSLKAANKLNTHEGELRTKNHVRRADVHAGKRVVLPSAAGMAASRRTSASDKAIINADKVRLGTSCNTQVRRTMQNESRCKQ